MDEWTDGQKDGWMGRRLGGWMDVWTGRCRVGRETDGWVVDGWMDWQMV